MQILEGLLYGLATLFIIGPVLILLVSATIQNGIKSGFAVAIGIFISDFIYAILCVKGLGKIINSSLLNNYISLIGFLILLGFGISYLLKKEKLVLKNNTTKNKTHFQNFLKGFSINFFNPFVLSFWLLLTKYGLEKYENKAITFLIALVLGILIIDLIKVILAKKLNNLLNSKKIFLFYKISAAVMILFSFRVLYHFLKSI